MNMSRVMSQDPAVDCVAWQLPRVSDSGAAPQPPSRADQDAQEALRKEAYDAGYQEGREQGIASGRGEVESEASRLRSVVGQLTQPLEALDEEVLDQTCRLALQIARHIIRREIGLNPGQIVASVHKAMDCLPVASRHIRIILHPEDVELVKDALSLDDTKPQWRVVENPMIERGGCRIETETAEIDATLDKRLNAILAEMLGGVREGDADDCVD